MKTTHHRDLLQQTDHRPWPCPPGPRSMTQTWYKLLFAHWPVSSAVLRPLIPDSFEIDTFDGQAWLGVVPFGMRDIRLRLLPPIPFTHTFLELNVRTYVIRDGKPGVFFFSLDAANLPAVWTARLWFNLPYFYARMSLTPGSTPDAQLHYRSERNHRNAPAASFEAHYGPTSPVFTATPQSLEYWLTERYCLYTTDRQGRPYRGEIHHLPWPLQNAEAEFQMNSLAYAHGIALPRTAPLLHYVEAIKVLVWSLQPLNLSRSEIA